MKSTKRILCIEANRIVDLILENNIKSYWQLALQRRRISDKLKQHMEIINSKYKYKYFSINQMENE